MPSSRHRRVGFVVACAVTLLATRAAAEPAPSDRLRMREPATLTVASGKTYELPPGRWMAEHVFEEKEAELKAAQESTVRLTAERDSYKKSAEQWQPGWKFAVSALVAGIAIGVYASTR